MPRDMTGTGRYAPQPKYKPISFYSAVRLGNPEQLDLIMKTDPYFVTQDNGAGAPLHFATTYKQLDMINYLLDLGAEINQRDEKGFTPLHRAAYLAHYEGYLEIYEFLLTKGADPSILTEDYDTYLDPGQKLAIDLAIDDDDTREKLKALDKKYSSVKKVRRPHVDIGCWWTLYDYGLPAIKTWAEDFKRNYPEEIRRNEEIAERKAKKEKRKQEKLKAAQIPPSSSQSAPQSSSHIDKVEVKKPAPTGPIAFVFPGQGSQAIGMLKESKDVPAVREMLTKAKTILGYDLLDVCLNGPKEKLDDTEFAQPALFVAGLAAVEKLRSENPKLVEDCSACAGLSLGEYCALAFAGVISFEEGLKAVKIRGESMSAAAKLGQPHGMLSIIGLDDKTLEEICSKVRDKMGGSIVCQLANYLFPTGRVVSGHKDALNQVQNLAATAGAMKCTPLAVSGAFHTPLMEPAREKLTQALKDISFKEPRIPVFSNVTANPFPDSASIPSMLARQLVEPVRWEDILVNLTKLNKTQFYECGPGQQLKAMMKRISTPIWKDMKNISA